MITRTKLLTLGLHICALLAISSPEHLSAQVRTPESHKWEYCAVTDSHGTGTQEKPYGVALITFFEEAGYREEYVRVDLEPPKNTGAGVLYEMAQKRAFAKAFSKLGNDDWELVGSLPFMQIASPSNTPGRVAIYFKRPKRP